MTPFLQFAIALIIIITAAKIDGYVSLKLGQPAVLGELAIGIILGLSVLHVFHWVPFTDKHLGETIAHIAELGVLLPLGLGYGLARAFSFDAQSALFTGLILAATSVSISAQTLMEMRVLRSRVGISLLGAVVFDAILVVLGLSIFVALAVGSGGLWGVAWIAMQMFLYTGIAAALGVFLLPKLRQKMDRLPISQGLMPLF